MKPEWIQEESAENCLTLWLNRPEMRNALNFELGAQLAAALKRAAQNKNIRGVVLRGRGGAFCAGGDLKLIRQHGKKTDLAFRKLSTLLNQAVASIRGMPKPVVAAVEGPAYAAGFGLAIACDLTVAAKTATFSPSFINIALAANASSTYFLPRMMGAKRAAEAFLRGRLFSADEAQRCGMVNQVWPPKRFESELAALMQELCARPTASLGRIKKLLRMSSENTWRQQVELEKSEIAASSRSRDFGEGVGAFLEKRRPHFLGY